MLPTLTKALLLCTFLTGAGFAQAQWELDNERSSLDFISIKNDQIAESHRFESLVGFIGAEGQVQVGVDLNSVETLIPIRNERMRELLFDTVNFPAANISAQVDPAVLAVVAGGGVVTSDIEITLSLHGEQATLTVPVVVFGEAGDVLRVVTSRPVVVNAGEFGLVAGVSALREIAGLSAISTAVPVTFALVFVPVSA